jgi:hypothetical protein
MSLSPEKTLAEKINTWMPIIGVVIAAIWGVYTFAFKEMIQPNSAPVNITMNLQFKKLISPSSKIVSSDEDLIAVEMMAIANNPSSREIYLLPSVWVAWGNKIEKSTGDNFDKLVNEALKAPEGNKMTEKYAWISKPSSSANTDTVASGRLFGDTVLKPNETITRRIVFHVPERFNVVDIWAAMPSTTEKDSFDAEWTFINNGLHNDIFCIVDGKRILLNPEGKDECPNKSELQWSTSLASFSLWQ